MISNALWHVSRLKRRRRAVVCLLAAAFAMTHPWLPLPQAAPPAARGPKKFFDSLIGRQPEPEPAFIQAPTPPGPEEVEMLERQAAASRPAAPAAGKPESKPEFKPESKPIPQTAPQIASRPPTWDETMAFASALKTTAEKVAAAASDPDFKPTSTRPPRSAARSSDVTKAIAVPAKRQSPSEAASASVGNGGSAAAKPSGTAAPATPRFAKLRTRIAQTLAAYQRRPLNTAQHTPWEVMHGFIAFGIPTKVRVGGPAGDPVNAIGWVNTGGRCGGQVMLAAAGDRLTALRGIGVQGHSAQYLAILAQSRVAMNSPITIQSKTFTVADLVKEEKLACKSGTELTFALIALAH
jgi:hypothetical protein